MELENMNNKERLEYFLQEFRTKYPLTIGWRLAKNSRVVLEHLYNDEEIEYAFYAQKNHSSFDIFGTAVIALTDKRLVIGRDRVVIGYFFDSITPDMFNDLKVKSGIIWGRIEIDMVKEFVVLSNIDKRALTEIEKKISSYMVEAKEDMLDVERIRNMEG